MSQYDIWVRDEANQLVGLVPGFSESEDPAGSLETVLRFNEVSSWVLNTYAGSPAMNALTWRGGIDVVKDGNVILSGPVGKIHRKLSDGRMVISGPDDLGLLSRRLTVPVVSGPPYTGATQDVRTGAAETIIKQYVNFNAGPSATAARRIDGLTIAGSTGLGTTITGRARFNNLLEFVTGLAVQGGGLGIKIQNMIFDVYQPSDKTGEIVFSYEMGSLSDFAYDLATPKANWVICGGGGTGTSRSFYEEGDSESVVKFGRYEVFKDQRQTTVTSELTQAVREELDGGADVWSFAVETVSLPEMSFFDDYYLGDRVTAVVDGVEISSLIQEVKIKVDRLGERIYPVVKSGGMRGGLLTSQYDKMREIRRRVENLEIV